jgi:YbbR domain-containing protein
MSAEQRPRTPWNQLRQAALDPERWRHAFTHNIQLKLLSFLFAFGLWSFVNLGERDTEEALKVPLALRNIPASLVITSPRVDFIDLRVSGPRTLLGRIDRGRLSLTLDLDGVSAGPAVFRVGAESLNLPRGVRVVRINPAVVTLDLERVARKTVPVQLQLDGEPPGGFKIVSARITPESVEVSGPAGVVKGIESVQTVPLELGEAEEGVVSQELPLEVVNDALSFTVSRVAAEVRIEEVQVRRELIDVPVEVRNASTPVEVVPPTVKVTVRGPKRMVAALSPGDLQVYADAAAGDGVVKLAADIPAPAELIAIDPKTGNLRITDATPPAATPSPRAAGKPASKKSARAGEAGRRP